MREKIFVFLLVISFLKTVSLADAQQPKKVFRIGYLSANAPATDVTRAKTIRQALSESGYIEGQNITIEYRYAENRLDRLPELAAELARLKVEVIIAAGGVILPAKQATKAIPIVMTGSGSDPVKAGFVESLARPGGNITGIISFSTELGGKRFEVFKEAIPKAIRIVVIYDPAAPGSVREVKEDLPIAARVPGLTVQPWEVKNSDALEKVFNALNKERVDGLYLRSGGPGLRADNEKRIIDFTVIRKVPSIYTNRRAIDVGGLMYYGADVADANRRVAYYVDRILKGAKPADLPVEQPTKFEFVVNLKTAK
jgi:putative tryptophan/tyrosine transport system substrate-binding protein